MKVYTQLTVHNTGIVLLLSTTVSTGSSYSVISELCHRVGPPRLVPRRIQLPTYGRTGKVPPQARMIEIKTTEQIEAMRKACRVARKVLSSARDIIKVLGTDYSLHFVRHLVELKSTRHPPSGSSMNCKTSRLPLDASSNFFICLLCLWIASTFVLLFRTCMNYEKHFKLQENRGYISKTKCKQHII